MLTHILKKRVYVMSTVVETSHFICRDPSHPLFGLRGQICPPCLFFYQLVSVANHFKCE